MLGVSLDNPEGQALVTQFKNWCMEAFSPICSGVLVDPVYGFDSIEHKADGCGLILTLENSGYGESREQVPELIPNWSVEHIKNNYAVAKLLVYFHPQEASALAKKELIASLSAQAKANDVAFLLEPVIYNPAGEKDLSLDEFHEAQLMTVRTFQQYVDVLKLQYPGSALACANITAELDVPWILLSRGLPFAEFVEALTVALENGCVGFAAGRAVWQETGELKTADGKPDAAAIQQFLQTTGVQRMSELIHLTTQA